jgi:hypothetical protein
MGFMDVCLMHREAQRCTEGRTSITSTATELALKGFVPQPTQESSFGSIVIFYWSMVGEEQLLSFDCLEQDSISVHHAGIRLNPAFEAFEIHKLVPFWVFVAHF